MSHKHWILALPMLGTLACSGANSGADGASAALPPATRVVFHTQSAMLVGNLTPDDNADSAASVTEQRVRERVKKFYPAACLDADSDNDGVPDSQDHTLDDSAASTDDDPATHEVGDDDGVHAAADGGTDDRAEADAALRCHACNRGPGVNGEFRYEENGGTAKLDRGRIVSRTDTTLVVAGPNGAITIELSDSTELDSSHGSATPGAEIRAEGTLRAGATRTIQASRVDILCPGPGVVPESELPTDVPLQPASATDTGAAPTVN